MNRAKFLTLTGDEQKEAVRDAAETLILAANWTPSFFTEAYRTWPMSRPDAAAIYAAVKAGEDYDPLRDDPPPESEGPYTHHDRPAWMRDNGQETKGDDQ